MIDSSGRLALGLVMTTLVSLLTVMVKLFVFLRRGHPKVALACGIWLSG